jgi:hypothetical protein
MKSPRLMAKSAKLYADLSRSRSQYVFWVRACPPSCEEGGLMVSRSSARVLQPGRSSPFCLFRRLAGRGRDVVSRCDIFSFRGDSSRSRGSISTGDCVHKIGHVIVVFERGKTKAKVVGCDLDRDSVLLANLEVVWDGRQPRGPR